MKSYKVSKKNRDRYIYYWADGTSEEITLNDVDSKWIEFLHEERDLEIDAERREKYHIPMRYGYDSEEDDAIKSDFNRLLIDEMANPLDVIMDAIEIQERKERHLKLKAAMKELSEEEFDLIYKIFFKGMARVKMAELEGVSETTIRKRLNKIFEKIRKKL